MYVSPVLVGYRAKQMYPSKEPSANLRDESYCHPFVCVCVCVFLINSGSRTLGLVFPKLNTTSSVKSGCLPVSFSCQPQRCARNYSGQPDSPEKALAPHSSTLAWKIPWTGEPGRLQSMGSLIVGHD